MRNGAKALTKSTTRLSSNYKISRLGIEVHIPNLWEVPTSQYAFNSLSKKLWATVLERSALVTTPSLLVLSALLKISPTALHVLNSGIECQRFAYLGPLVGKV